MATDCGWMVRGSNPSGDEFFHTHPDRPWGPPNLLYMGTVSFLEVKQLGYDVNTTHPHLVLRLKKE